MRGFILSLDPAQVRDWSALTAVEATRKPGEKEITYKLVNIERRQRLPYDQIVSWTIGAFKTPAFRQNTTFGPVLCLDSTGVGIAIRDMFLKAGITPVSISITSGNGHNVPNRRSHNVGKARLIGKFLAAFDDGRYQIPIWKIQTILQLHKELKSFRGDLANKGAAKFEAEPGEHDDMVLSCAMGCWFGEDVLKPRRPSFRAPVKATCFGNHLLDECGIDPMPEEEEDRGSWLQINGDGTLRMKW